MTALELFGLMVVAPDEVTPPMAGVEVIRVRGIGAVVRAAPEPSLDPELAAADHDRVLDALIAHGAVLPAPLGMVFRSAETARRWLEQNYVGLGEGLAFLAGRCEARVHVRTAAHPASADVTAALELEAAKAMRALRHSVVAVTPLASPRAPVVLSVAFLLKTTEWGEFTEAVREQERRYTELRFEQTGPWVPHDFVRLDLGA